MGCVDNVLRSSRTSNTRLTTGFAACYTQIYTADQTTRRCPETTPFHYGSQLVLTSTRATSSDTAYRIARPLNSGAQRSQSKSRPSPRYAMRVYRAETDYGACRCVAKRKARERGFRVDFRPRVFVATNQRCRLEPCDGCRIEVAGCRRVHARAANARALSGMRSGGRAPRNTRVAQRRILMPVCVTLFSRDRP